MFGIVYKNNLLILFFLIGYEWFVFQELRVERTSGWKPNKNQFKK